MALAEYVVLFIAALNLLSAIIVSIEGIPSLIVFKIIPAVFAVLLAAVAFKII